MGRAQTETNLNNDVAQNNHGAAGPGALLLRARTSKNLTPEQVAAELFLDVQLINALERDQFSKLPPPMYVRGYLRAYARLVGLDESGVTEAYERVTGSRGVEPEFKGQVYGKPRNVITNGGASWIGWLMLVVFGLGGYWAWVARDAWLPTQWVEALSATSPEPAITQINTVEPVPIASLSAVPGDTLLRQTTADMNAVANDAVPSAALVSSAPSVSDVPANLATSTAVTAAPPVAEPAAANIAPASPADAGIDVITPPSDEPMEEMAETTSPSASLSAEPEPAEAAFGANVPPTDSTAVTTPETSEVVATTIVETTVPATPLVAETVTTLEETVATDAAVAQEIALRLARESWVQISDGEGKKLAYGILSAGQSHAYSGKPPFKVVLGYAVGAEVMLNGQPFDLARYINGNVARFEAGDR
jgi:cytoskeleton protein RodZ